MNFTIFAPVYPGKSGRALDFERPSGTGETGGAEAEEPPEERLAFALSDSRVGVLAVKGRKARSS